MGLDEHSGLRGKLRASVDAMQSELRKWPVGTVAETYVRVLTMRVIEKDFILYGDINVMGGHRKAYREFEFGMMGSGLDPATQETLTRLRRNRHRLGRRPGRGHRIDKPQRRDGR